MLYRENSKHILQTTLRTFLTVYNELLCNNQGIFYLVNGVSLIHMTFFLKLIFDTAVNKKHRESRWSLPYATMETRGGWSRNAFRNCFWERYCRRGVSQLLAIFSPVPSNSPRSLCVVNSVRPHSVQLPSRF